MFLGSKFILTVRKNKEVWLKSLKSHSMRNHPTKNCRKLAYGYNYITGHEKEHLQFYERHNDSVRAYFQGREADFIEVCWEYGHGWHELCGFLDKSFPNCSFPHANKGSTRRPKKIRVLTNRILSIFRH